MSAPAVLFVTRKYPPARGGMEEFSHQLFEAYPGPKRLMAMTRSQAWLPAFCAQALAGARSSRRQFDALHLGDGMLAPFAAVLERSAQSPAFVTIHGQEVTRDVPGYRQALRAGLTRLGERVIAVSAFTAGEAARLHGATGAAVIANGVDVARFKRVVRRPGDGAARAGLGLPPDGPLIVSVGRLVRRKGALWFAAEVLPHLPSNATFVVAGTGADLRPLRSMAAADPRIRPLGLVADAVVEDLYAVADLVVAPNVAVQGRPEGYGVAPAEAACAGVPVLVSGVEGLVDMARETGLPTVPSGDAGAWVDAIQRTLSQPEWAVARRPPRSWEVVAQDYARYFGVVLSRQAGSERCSQAQA